MKLNRTQNKLLKNGYLPEVQTSSYEKWIDVREAGTPISFNFSKNEINGSVKVHGHHPDLPEADLFFSTFTRNVKEAIIMSRII